MIVVFLLLHIALYLQNEQDSETFVYNKSIIKKHLEQSVFVQCKDDSFSSDQSKKRWKSKI